MDQWFECRLLPPEYLNCETDDPSPGVGPVAPVISTEEMELLRKLRRLSRGDQGMIMRMTTALARAERRAAEDAAKSEEKKPGGD